MDRPRPTPHPRRSANPALDRDPRRRSVTSRCAASQQRLADALLQFEETAGPPVRPGHASRWCVDALRSTEFLENAWRAHDANREAVFRDIEEVEPALAPRVDSLRARGAELGESLHDIVRRLRVVAARDGCTGSEEPYQGTLRIRDDCLQWVVGARAFEMELRSWFMEAYQRELGDGD